MSIHFGVCGGIFQQHLTLMNGIWLFSLLQKEVGDKIRLHLALPNLREESVNYFDFRAPRKATMKPFDHFYSLRFLKRKLSALKLAAHPQIKHCQSQLVISPPLGSTNVSLSEFLSPIVAALNENPDGACSYLSLKSGGSEGCLYELGHLPFVQRRRTLSQEIGFEYLEFAREWLKFAEPAILKLLGIGYSAIHLRLENDFIQTYRPGYKFNVTKLEKCLIRLQPRMTNLYVAGGDMVFVTREFMDWKRQTRFKLITKKDMPFQKILSAEEWAVIEAIIARKAKVFFGLLPSSMSVYILKYREALRANGGPPSAIAALKHRSERKHEKEMVKDRPTATRSFDLSENCHHLWFRDLDSEIPEEVLAAERGL